MFNLMDTVGNLMGGKIDAGAVKDVMNMVQNHINLSQQQPETSPNALTTVIAEKLGVNAGIIQMVMPQLMQAVQNGHLQALLDRNHDNQIDTADLMSLLKH